MAIEKLDVAAIGDSQTLALANKINEVIESLSGAAPAATPAATPAVAA